MLAAGRFGIGGQPLGHGERTFDAHPATLAAFKLKRQVIEELDRDRAQRRLGEAQRDSAWLGHRHLFRKTGE